MVRNAMLIRFFFGGLSEFFEQVTDSSIHSRVDFPRRGNKAKCASKYASSSAGLPLARAENRRVLKTWLLSCSRPTRSMAQWLFPEEVRWLREHDARWYDSMLPAVGASVHAERTTLRWKAAGEETEATAMAHVQARLALLVGSALEPVRITRPLLAAGLPRPLIKYRLATAFANKVIETKVQFNERRALWLFLHPEHTP